MARLACCIVLLGLFLGALATVENSGSCTSYVAKAACSALYKDHGAQAVESFISEASDADCALACPSDYPIQYCPDEGEEFDFIVVGAGSAGCVVANRLTEVTDWRVLLVEAGGNPTKTVEMPSLAPLLQKTEMDWQYQTEPGNNYCLGMINNSCIWPRGKVLGGCSSINYMFYLRGNAKDYEGWAATGNTGWGYDSVLPYFKKYENMRAEEILATPDFSKYHSTGGLQTVDTFQNDEVKALADAFAAGWKELGLPINPDVNGKTQTGFVKVQATIRDGRRCSTAKAFLSPIKERSNLKVCKNSLVTKILIDAKNLTAYGIKFVDDRGKVVTVRAKKEVISSAGSINGAQLLMLSGIGPRKHLEELKIPVIADLPVGESLRDHLMTYGFVISLNYTKPPEDRSKNMFDFLFTGKGRLCGTGLVSYGALLNTVKDVDYPDVQLFLLDFEKNSFGLGAALKLQNFKEEIIKKYTEINTDSYVVLVLSVLLRPYSVGNIKLKSTDPKVYPKITADYFTDPRDLEPYLRTYDVIAKWVQTGALKSVGAKLHEIEVPGCSTFTFASKAYRECSLRHLTGTAYHYCSTCKMGPAGSADSVVDPNLLVKDVKGLRVIDASVMATEVSGNINGAVIMIGEKGSDSIKETWLSGKSGKKAN